MCVEIYLPDQRCRITDTDELRTLIAPARLVVRDGYGPVLGICCLCPVDIDATALAGGFRSQPSPDDPSVFIWRRCGDDASTRGGE